MLTQETLQALKEAGLDFGYLCHEFIRDKYEDLCCMRCGYNSNVLCQPSLEELIEACGATYGEYEFFLAYNVDKWFANYSDGEFKLTKSLPHIEGSTRKQAVANLFISLNTK